MTDSTSLDLMTVLSYTIAFTVGAGGVWLVLVRPIIAVLQWQSTTILLLIHCIEESHLQETLSKLQKDGPWLHVGGLDD